MNERQRLGFGLGGLFLVIAVFIIYLSWPLMTGTEVVLDTRPVDPFDIFRGQYMAIRYDISSLPAPIDATPGDTVYVSLIQNGSVWSYAGASLSRPDGLFIKGRVTNVYGDTMNVEYGIEQYFFEKSAEVPTSNITVKAKIGGDGTARIVELLQNGKPAVITYEKNIS